MRSQTDQQRQKGAILLLVSFVWLLTTGIVSVVQMQVNDDAVEAWRRSVDLRRNVPLPTEAPRDPSQVAKFVTAALDAIEARRQVLGQASSDAKLVAEDLRVLARAAKAILQRENDADESAKMHAVDADMHAKWLEVKGRRAMRTQCSDARETETHLRELMHRLTQHVERQGGVTIDQVRRVAEQPAVDDLIHRLEETLDHLEHKMAGISKLWPQWFDEAHDEEPISKGLFLPNAEEYPTCPQGRQEYQARVAALNGA